MATFDDVRRIAMGLPRTDERESRGMLQWRVAEKLFVWERPLRRADLEHLGDRARRPVLGARVEHVDMKDALIAEDPAVFFTTPHFDGYPAILVRLERITVERLKDLVTDAWLARAPVKIRQELSRGVLPAASSLRNGTPPHPVSSASALLLRYLGRSPEDATRAKRAPAGSPAAGGARLGIAASASEGMPLARTGGRYSPPSQRCIASPDRARAASPSTSLRVGCGATARESSNGVASSSAPSAGPAMSSVTSWPMRWTPRTSLVAASATTLQKPSGSPQMSARPLARKGKTPVRTSWPAARASPSPRPREPIWGLQ